MTQTQTEFSVPVSLQERRCEWRYSAGSAEALVIDASKPNIFSGRILDLSKNGIGLILGEALKPGSSIEVLLKSTAIVGEVRNCTLVENNEYRVGVKIKSITQRPPASADLRGDTTSPDGSLAP